MIETVQLFWKICFEEMHDLGVGSDLGIHIILSKTISDLSRSIETMLSILKDINCHTCCSKLLSKGHSSRTSRWVRNCIGRTLQNKDRCIGLPGAALYTAEG